MREGEDLRALKPDLNDGIVDLTTPDVRKDVGTRGNGVNIPILNMNSSPGRAMIHQFICQTTKAR